MTGILFRAIRIPGGQKTALALLAIALVIVFRMVCVIPTYSAALYTPPNAHPAKQEPVYLMQFTYKEGDPTLFYITADDCIESLYVNKLNIPIPADKDLNPSYAPHRYCSGITADLSPALRQGSNEIRIALKDFSASRRFSMLPIWPILSHFPAGTPLIAAVICLFMLAHARWCDFDTATWGFLLVAMQLSIWHYTRTSYRTYGQDLVGHLSYIIAIANHGWRWNIFVNSIFRHPPGYYLISGFVYALARKFGAPDAFFYARAVSLVFFSVFMYFSVRTIGLLMKEMRRRYYFLALAVFVFWPHHYIVMGTINCDVAEYAFHMAATYWLISWAASRAPDALWRTLLYTALAFLMKNSALILGFAVLCVGLCQWESLSVRLLLGKRFLAVYALGLMVVAVGIGYNFIYAKFYGPPNEAVLAAYIGPSVESRGFEVFLPDFRAYFDKPFIEYGPPDSTLNNFPNVFLKTMVFGEYRWRSAQFAAWLLPLHLVVIMLAGLYMLSIPRHALRSEAVSVFMILTSVGAVIAYRLTYDIASTQNFRYCYPLMPLLVVWSAKGVRLLSDRDLPIPALGGWAACSAFAALSVAFIIAQCVL